MHGGQRRPLKGRRLEHRSCWRIRWCCWLPAEHRPGPGQRSSGIARRRSTPRPWEGTRCSGHGRQAEAEMRGLSALNRRPSTAATLKRQTQWPPQAAPPEQLPLGACPRGVLLEQGHGTRAVPAVLRGSVCQQRPRGAAPRAGSAQVAPGAAPVGAVLRARRARDAWMHGWVGRTPLVRSAADAGTSQAHAMPCHPRPRQRGAPWRSAKTG